jgi:hypothetical protein
MLTSNPARIICLIACGVQIAANAPSIRQRRANQAAAGSAPVRLHA